jgi:hypothetical protein
VIGSLESWSASIAGVAFVLKPRLEIAGDGAISAAVYLETATGDALGITSASAHDTEQEAREALRVGLVQLLMVKDVVIAVDGVHFDRDVAQAVAAVVVEGASRTLRKESSVGDAAVEALVGGRTR